MFQIFFRNLRCRNIFPKEYFSAPKRDSSEKTVEICTWNFLKIEFWKQKLFFPRKKILMFPDSLKTFQPIRSSRLASFSLHIYLQIYIYIWAKSFNLFHSVFHLWVWKGWLEARSLLKLKLFNFVDKYLGILYVKKFLLNKDKYRINLLEIEFGLLPKDTFPSLKKKFLFFDI